MRRPTVPADYYKLPGDVGAIFFFLFFFRSGDLHVTRWLVAGGCGSMSCLSISAEKIHQI